MFPSNLNPLNNLDRAYLLLVLWILLRVELSNIRDSKRLDYLIYKLTLPNQLFAAIIHLALMLSLVCVCVPKAVGWWHAVNKGTCALYVHRTVQSILLKWDPKYHDFASRFLLSTCDSASNSVDFDCLAVAVAVAAATAAAVDKSVFNPNHVGNKNLRRTNLMCVLMTCRLSLCNTHMQIYR